MEVHDVSLTEALRRLDAIRHRFTDRVAEGGISVWAGSAISQTRFPNLGALLTQLLCKLHRAIENPSDPEDAALITLKRIIKKSGAAGAQSLSATDHIDTWAPPLRKAVIDGLWSRYSDVLAISYRPGGASASLALDVLHVDELYSDATIHPDAEHRLLALLVQEGVFRDLITTNWDDLIERAHAQASDGTAPSDLRAVVFKEDLLDLAAHTPRLTKIHGCAERARTEKRARDLLVATAAQIVDWIDDQERRAIREVFTTTARDHGVLYLGLSGQDINIQLSHVQARLDVDSAQAVAAPRVLFAERGIGEDQERVLNASYGAIYDGPGREAIEEAALVPLYAKPLLGGLLVFILREKLYAFADAHPVDAHRTLARDGIDALVQHVTAAADAIPDPARRWRYVSDTVARYVSSFNRLFSKGERLHGRWTYHPLTTQALLDPKPTDYKLALLIGILATGASDERWTLEFTPDEPEQLRIQTAGNDALPIYIVYDNSVSPNLLTFCPPDRDYLVIHIHGNTPALPPRRPRAALSEFSDRARRVAASRSATMETVSVPTNQRFDLYLDDWTADPTGPVQALHRQLYDLSVVNRPYA